MNVSTELEMTSDARQNGGKARNVKHYKCAKPVILKGFSLLIGPNDRCKLWRNVKRSVDTLFGSDTTFFLAFHVLLNKIKKKVINES